MASQQKSRVVACSWTLSSCSYYHPHHVVMPIYAHIQQHLWCFAWCTGWNYICDDGEIRFWVCIQYMYVYFHPKMMFAYTRKNQSLLEVLLHDFHLASGLMQTMSMMSILLEWRSNVDIKQAPDSKSFTSSIYGHPTSRNIPLQFHTSLLRTRAHYLYHLINDG